MGNISSAFRITLNTTLLFEIHFRQHPRDIFFLLQHCGNDGRVPCRRLRTMAQVPLNLRKFLPETNIARNSNLGVEVQLYGGGGNNSRSNNGDHLILSCDPAELCSEVLVRFSSWLIRLPEKHTGSNQETTMGPSRRGEPRVVNSSAQCSQAQTNNQTFLLNLNT